MNGKQAEKAVYKEGKLIVADLEIACAFTDLKISLSPLKWAHGSQKQKCLKPWTSSCSRKSHHPSREVTLTHRLHRKYKPYSAPSRTSCVQQQLCTACGLERKQQQVANQILTPAKLRLDTQTASVSSDTTHVFGSSFNSQDKACNPLLAGLSNLTVCSPSKQDLKSCPSFSTYRQPRSEASHCNQQQYSKTMSCSQQARHTDSPSADELAGYLDEILHIPKKMSSMAEMMYT